MKKEKIRLVLINILVLLGLVLCSFIVLEFGIRLSGKSAAKSVYDTERVPMPYVSFSGSPENSYHNENGYRGKVLKKTDGIDIVILGGSTVYNGRPAIPELLENLLRSKFKKLKFNVYNFGIPASKSSEDLSRLIHQVTQYRPELVISYNGSNDIGLLGGDPRVGYPFDFYVVERNPLAKGSPHSLGLIKTLIVQSHFLRVNFPDFIHRNILGLHKLVRTHLKDEKLRSFKAVALLRSNIEKMMIISRAFGASYIPILHPIKKQDFNNDNGLWFGVPILKEEISQSENLGIISYLDIFKDKQDCFRDDVHTLQSCKELIAAKLVNVVEKVLKLAPPFLR